MAKYIYVCKYCGDCHVTPTMTDSVYCTAAWREVEATLIGTLESVPTYQATIHRELVFPFSTASVDLHYSPQTATLDDVRAFWRANRQIAYRYY